MLNMTWLHQIFPDYEIVLEYDDIDDKTKPKEEIHGIGRLPSSNPSQQVKNSDDNSKDNNANNTIDNSDNTGNTGNNSPPLFCLSCHKPCSLWTKKDVAHAISECLGNKRLINALECYDCNHLFGEIAENHLGKFIMPYRFIAEVYGKDRRKGKGRQKNVIRDGKQGKDSSEPFRTFRFEQKKNAPVFESEIFPSETYPFDIHSLLIEVKDKGGRLEFTDYGFKMRIPRQTYDPRMVYASFLKMFYTLLPCVKQPAGTINDDIYNPYNPQARGQEQCQEHNQSQSQSQEHYDIYSSDYCDYIQGQIYLYLALSKKNPLYAPDGSIAFLPFSEEEREKYLSSLPNKGFEVRYASKDIPNGVNVCLLRKRNGVSKATTSTVFNENETAGIGNRAGIAVDIENNQDNDSVECGIENSANNANSESIATISRDEPRYLFAVQLKWYTIVIPACSDPIQLLQPDMPTVATASANTAANVDNIDNQDILSNSGNILEPAIPYHCEIHCTPTSEITVRPLDFTQVESEMIFDMQAEKIDIPEELYDSLAEDLRKAGLLKEKKMDGQDGQDGQNDQGEQDEQNKQVASSLLIQGFAKLHAIYAAILAQTLIGDEASLVSLTLAMIMSITQICGAEWSTGQAASFFKIFIDYYVMNRGFAFPLKWIPFVGNAVNAFIAFYMAETFGWVTYAFINDGLKNPSSLSAQERKALLEKAEGLRKGGDAKASAKKIYAKLKDNDKKEFKKDLARIIDHLREKDISYEERENYLNDLEKLVKNYAERK